MEYKNNTIELQSRHPFLIGFVISMIIIYIATELVVQKEGMVTAFVIAPYQ